MEKAKKRERKDVVDMTRGNYVSQIIAFTLPLLAGQLFQQLYNTFDTWCVGNFVGKNSFSAVGTVGSVTNMLIGFAGGFATGASVVISNYFGAKDEEGAKKATHTFVAFSLILSVVLTALGLLLLPALLRFLNAPPEVREEQRIYLTIYFWGMTALLIYNMGSSIFRAVGNSRLPFIFLVVSAVANIILDLVFVIVFKWGTAGVAWATVISQSLSAVLTVIALMRARSCVKVSIRSISIDWSILKRIIVIGFPSAIQMALTSFSNVFVQSYINYFGTDVMGGWTAYSKLDQLLFLPMQCIGLASMTFMGQNIGSNDLKRARKGTNAALLMAFAITIALIIPVEFLAPSITKFFISGDESGVIEYGSLFLRALSPFYIVCCMNQVYGSALRGAGKSQTPMYVMLFSFVLARQAYLFIVSRYISNTVLPIAFSYPFGWALCSLLISICYWRFMHKATKKIAAEGN